MELRKDRPSYVKFETKQEEDRAATLENGHYTAKDVDYAMITPVGSKDIIPRKVDEWLPQLRQQVQEERIPAEWADLYTKSYELWKKGQEIPLNGVPIRGWQMLSPSQMETVIRANILTVEDLAQIGDEAQRRIGMGALDLKNKAKNWLDSAKSAGISAATMSAQQVKLNASEARIKTLEEEKQALQAEVNRLKQYEPKTKAA